MSFSLHQDEVSHVTRVNESCHSCKWVMSHIWMSYAAMTVGTMDLRKHPTEPTYECGLRIFRNPSEPTRQRQSPQYGKAEASKISHTFCWLKLLRMHFNVKFFRMHFCRFIENFRAGVPNKFLQRGVSIKISVNKMYKLFYSTTLFRTTGSDVVLWVQRDSWKFWAHTHMWARSDVSLSPLSPLYEFVSASRWGESCHTREWVMAHISMSYTATILSLRQDEVQHVTRINESCHTRKWVMSHI